jgi:ATP-dependent Clp protease ATP-binding subunit ClpC
MFERFTEVARRVVVQAQEEARRLGHDHIGTEHLLLGLTAEHESVAAKALEALDFTHESARRQVVEYVGLGRGSPPGHIPFSRGAKRALESALREAVEIGDHHIGSEHLLLALARDEKDTAAQALVRYGLALHDVRAQVLELCHAHTVTTGPTCTRCRSAVTGALVRSDARVPAAGGGDELDIGFLRCASCGAVVGVVAGGK